MPAKRRARLPARSARRAQRNPNDRHLADRHLSDAESSFATAMSHLTIARRAIENACDHVRSASAYLSDKTAKNAANYIEGERRELSNDVFFARRKAGALREYAREARNPVVTPDELPDPRDDRQYEIHHGRGLK